MQRTQAQEITDKERVRLVQEFNKRFAQDYQLLDEYRGQGYIENVPGGVRTYTFVRPNFARRPQNRWLMLAGVRAHLWRHRRFYHRGTTAAGAAVEVAPGLQGARIIPAWPAAFPRVSSTN